MRIVMDIASDKILQLEKTPEIGIPHTFNGRYSIPVPDGAAFSTDDLPPTPTPQDIAALAAAGLLAQFPMYDNIAYNFLLDASDVADIDLAGTGPTGQITRVNIGRGVGPGPTGMFPNMATLPPQNSRVAPPRPGCMVTEVIDITVPTSGAGADEFLVWWHLYTFQTTDEVVSDFGIFSGANQPCEKSILEEDPEVGDLDVYISHDNGATWTGPIGRLEPTDLTVFDTDVRLAFLNTGTNRIYLAAYAILF
jgi:hypothetical protein